MTQEEIINKILEKVDSIIENNRVLVQSRGMLGDYPKFSKHGNYITVHTLKKELSKKKLKKIFQEKDDTHHITKPLQKIKS